MHYCMSLTVLQTFLCKQSIATFDLKPRHECVKCAYRYRNSEGHTLLLRCTQSQRSGNASQDGFEGLTSRVCVLTVEDATLAGLEEIDQHVEEGHVGEDKEACDDYCEHTATCSSTCGQQSCLSLHGSGRARTAA